MGGWLVGVHASALVVRFGLLLGGDHPGVLHGRELPRNVFEGLDWRREVPMKLVVILHDPDLGAYSFSLIGTVKQDVDASQQDPQFASGGAVEVVLEEGLDLAVDPPPDALDILAARSSRRACR